MAKCEVTVRDKHGKRWTMVVEAKSRNTAIAAYNAEQVCGFHRQYPKLLPETEIEVRIEDGRVFHTTFQKVLEWSSREGAARLKALLRSRARLIR